MSSHAEAPADATLADVLRVCEPSMSAALVDSAHLAGLTHACRRLPREFSAFWGLESALGDPRGEVDLLVEIKGGSPRRAVLAGTAASPLLDALCQRVEAWAELRRFARAWEDEDGRPQALVRNVWLEFDLIAAAAANPPFDALERPSVFWGPDVVERDDWPTFLAFVAFVRRHFALFPAPLPLGAIERAVRQLPPGARVFQVGAMQTRGDVMLRVCVNRLSPADVPAWLRTQGWNGDADALDVALGDVAPLVRLVALDVDYTASGIGPKIGFECYQHWNDLAPTQWQPLLTHVSGLGLCVPSKRDAVASFPAKTESASPRAEDGVLFPVIYRNIHHVKLSFIGDAFREAKAYLGITRPGVKLPRTLTPIGEPEDWLST
jgi:hypothetical protein